MSISSKGLDLYGYKKDEDQKLTFKLKQPGASKTDNYTVQTENETYTRHLEVNSDLPLHLNGDYSFEAEDCLNRSCEINSVTGNITNSNMNDMLGNQQCHTCSDGIISYGFYDAGSGYGDEAYTSHHQSYVYCGDSNRAEWMGRLVSQNKEVGERAFSTFVLPGAHDAGMNTSVNISEVANNAKSIAAILALIGGWIAGIFGIAASAVIYLLGTLAANRIKLIMINLGITQKDSITNMLNMGIRYFDFRPGYNAEIKGYKVASGDGLYHQHNFLPGMKFDDFLEEIVNWLETHEGEIVVVSLGFSGFYDKKMKPKVQTIKNAVKSALSNSSFVNGNIDDTKLTYNQLIKDKKRLLFLNNGIGLNDARKYDSYSDDAYATLTPDTIISSLNKMHFTPPARDQYTVLQFQGTASGVDSLWPKLAEYTSNASSPLLMTKAYFDKSTYEWAGEKLASFDDQFLTVILNDFVDPVMSQLSEIATLARAGD